MRLVRLGNISFIFISICLGDNINPDSIQYIQQKDRDASSIILDESVFDKDNISRNNIKNSPSRNGEGNK